jgi:hypothetical protein
MKRIYFALAISLHFFVEAQNVGINASGNAPEASAMLDVSASNKGLLIPRVSLLSTTDNTTVPTPTTSLLVYNTNASITNGNGEGYYYNGGTPSSPNWVKLYASNGKPWETTGNAGTSASSNFLGTTDAVDLVLRTNNAEKMRIMSGGNVGIGTANPGNRLSVQTSTSNDGIFASDGTEWMLNLPGTTGNGSYNGIVTANDNAIIFSGGTQGTGNLVIAPWASATSGIKILGSNGNVGIGITSPSSKLHVNEGSARISGSTNTNAETGGMLIYDNALGLGGGTAKKVERMVSLTISNNGSLSSNTYNGNANAIYPVYEDFTGFFAITRTADAYYLIFSPKTGFQNATYRYSTVGAPSISDGGTVTTRRNTRVPTNVGTYYVVSYDVGYTNNPFDLMVARDNEYTTPVYKFRVWFHSTHDSQRGLTCITEAYYR